MRKSFALLAAVAAALTSTIGMAREGQRTFQHDGSTYVYTTTVANDRQIITGRRYPSGTPFRLVVRGEGRDARDSARLALTRLHERGSGHGCSPFRGDSVRTRRADRSLRPVRDSAPPHSDRSSRR
jgi:hypothetical protein